ncbi:MAG TPA: kelch repeat-containing protein [Bacteroidia bacterium]|jgi:outer membrane protein OmpA-like peptidoglycan-associated protein/N-acetylneuraminic acid mutarotase|nr:kelch repeat-containing protein [Bacteroidia bacterium]
MKRFFRYFPVIPLYLLTTFSLSAQNKEMVWEKKAVFTGGKIKGEVAFAVGNRGYVFVETDCWQYDPKTDNWKKIADFPGTTRKSATSFTIGDKAYVATGLVGEGDAQKGSTELWEYSSGTGKWEKKADLPDGIRYGAIGFSIDGKGYVGLGTTPGNSTAYNDLWEYDPQADSWTKRADFPEKGRIGASVFVINGLAYVLFGELPMEVAATKKSVYVYNPKKNVWAKDVDFPGQSRVGAAVFSLNNKGYVYSGYNGVSIRYRDFWEFDPNSKAWKQNADTLPDARSDAFSFVIDSMAFMGAGKLKNTFLGVGAGANDLWCVSLKKNVDYHAKLIYQDNNQKLPLGQQGVSLISEKKVIQTTTTDNTGAFAFKKINADQPYQVVLDKNSKLPANAVVAIAKPNGKIVQNLQRNNSGQFAYELSNIDTLDEEDTYFNLQYFIKSSDTATTITTHINYPPASWDLNEEAQNVLYQVVAALDKYPNLIVRISSHTDATGDEDDNMKLSEQRAKTAVDFIVANGIDAKRVTGKGYGDTKLLNKCKKGVKCSDEENKVNRRTEFKFVKLR